MSKGRDDEHSEEHDEDEAEGETSATSEAGDEEIATEPTVTPRPRAKRASPASATEAGTPITPFGAVPKDVTHWLVRRQTINGWEAIGWAPPGALAEQTEFALSELSEQTLSERWGPGLYEIAWVRHLAGGGRNVLRGTRHVRIVAQPPAPVPPAHVASSLGALDDAMKVISLINREADAKLQGLAMLAERIGGSRNGGLTGEELRSILRDEREANAKATAEAIRAAVAPLQQRIEELSDEDDEDDEDDESNPLADAARAAAPRIFKGRKWWHDVGNYAASNPDVVKAVVPAVLGAVNNVSTAIASAVSTPAPRPRAVMTQPSAPPPPPPPPPPLPEAPPTPPPPQTGDPISVASNQAQAPSDVGPPRSMIEPVAAAS